MIATPDGRMPYGILPSVVSGNAMGVAAGGFGKCRAGWALWLVMAGTLQAVPYDFEWNVLHGRSDGDALNRWAGGVLSGG